jgi:hypothetical protein
VTVNGPIRYAIDHNKFYIQDEDGKVFEMALSQKALNTRTP